jgi:HKD family nuclease
MTQVDRDPTNQLQVEFFPDTDALRKRFEELIVQAQDIEIAVAWAGKPEEGIQNLLWRMRRKVRKLVVGCSLCNTNPDFLKKWQRHPGFRVVLDTTEVFHPKLYLFRAGGEVHLFIGSSNLTGGGFDKNQEANILLRGRNAGPIAEAAAYIKDRHREATKPGGKVWAEWLASYRVSWNKKPKLARSIQTRGAKSAQFGARAQGLEDWTFPEYFEQLKAGNPALYPLSDWLEFLEYVRSRWAAAGWSLRRMPEQDRSYVAGTKNPPHLEAGLFGRVGLGHLLHAVINKPAPIDQALRCIPREGRVETRHWAEFERLYSAAFEKAATGSASRLLCLWRPDVFFSANSGSVPEIALRSGFSQSSLRTLSGYWEAVKWVMRRPWYRATKPQGKLAERCWQGRVALLDVLVYRYRPRR